MYSVIVGYLQMIIYMFHLQKTYDQVIASKEYGTEYWVKSIYQGRSVYRYMWACLAQWHGGKIPVERACKPDPNQFLSDIQIQTPRANYN